MKHNRANSQSGCSAYDIPNDKRRTRVQKIQLGYGKWTQYSFFECFFNLRDLLHLRSKLEHHLGEAEESVRFYPLCAVCVSNVGTVGRLPPAEDILFVIGCLKNRGSPKQRR